jgi:hypothetical protein
MMFPDGLQFINEFSVARFILPPPHIVCRFPANLST